MDYLDSFGDWLRQRRESLRLTRPDLAECAGCSVSALRKIEADERRPSRELAELLGGCLNILPEEQPVFLDAARGVRPVARLGRPSPRLIPHPLPQPPVPSDASCGSLAGQPAWNLPAPATPLIGRETELATLAQLLGDPDCRLLSLVGPGGIGKTRLALEAACLMWERFADGVFFASLATTSSPEFMVSAIARTIGLNFSGPAEARTQLVNHLQNKRVLLLLDSLEHLLEGVDVLVELLAGAQLVKLLVTSRERLGLSGEWVFEVQGLPVPAEGEEEGQEECSAVQLFLQRARQARVDFELSIEDCPDVARICRLVEGMPLAIELAATWVPVLSCAEIAREIKQGLDILATRLRDIPERQRSLRAVFEHSWHLLDTEEQQTLARLAVFQGGLTREAARAVAGANLRLLSALVAKSFLRRTSAGPYNFHELLRQFAADRLAETPEEEVAARDRHSAYYVDFVVRLEDELKGAGQLQALAEMDAEIDNIRAGWRWALQRGELAAVRKPVRALWYFYEMHSWFQEAEASFARAADEMDTALRPGNADDDAKSLREYLRALLGWFYLRRGKLEKADLLLQSSLASLRSFAPGIELADVLYYAGAAAWMSGDYPRARAHFLEELVVAEQFGNEWDIGLATGNIGLAAQTVGEYEEAQQRWQTALAIERNLGDQRMVAAALHFSGMLKRTVGAYAEAQARFRECLALSETVGERWLYGMALSQLGMVTQALGDHAEAVGLLNESVTLLRELGEHWSLLHALIGLGGATLAMGAFAESRAAYYEVLRMAWERQALPEVLEAMTGLARWSAEQGEPKQALVTAFFVLNHPAATEQTKEAARQFWTELEAQVGPEQIVEAQASAENLSLESFVARVPAESRLLQ
jgi:predicted ATPase/transcriptional regulator with XRE-family HTH domain